MDMPSSRRPSQEEPQISTGASQTRNTNIADEVISITSGTNTPASSTTNIDEEEELNNEEQYSFSPIPIFSIPTSPTNYTGSPFTIGSIPSSPTNGMGSPTIIGLSPPTGASSPSEAHSPVVIPLYPASPPVTGSPITSNPASPLAFDTGFPIDFISHLRSPSPYSLISIPRSPVYNPNSPVYYPNSPEQYTNQETEQNENPGGDNVHNTSTNFDRDAGRLGSMTETTIPESDKESVYDVPEIDLPTDFIDLATDEEEVYELASDDDVNEVAIQQLIEDNVEETFYEIEPVESVENSILDGQEETTFEEALEDGVEDENDAIIEQSSANESQAASDEDNEVFYDADDSAFIELADRVENDLKKKQRQVEPGSLLPVLIEPTTLSKRKRDSDDEGSQDVFNKVHRSQISNSSRSTLDEVPFIEIPSPSAMNTNRQADEPTSSEIRAIYGISDDKPISLPSIYSLEPEDDNMDLGQPEAEKPTDTGFSVIDESRLLQEDIVDQVAIQPGHSTIFTQKQVDLIPSFHDDTQVPLIDWRDEEAKLAMICLQPTNCSVPQFRLIPDSTTSLLEQNRTLRLWWYDAYERHDNGSVYLFGKVCL
jgi:hypothetical protein